MFDAAIARHRGSQHEFSTSILSNFFCGNRPSSESPCLDKGCQKPWMVGNDQFVKLRTEDIFGRSVTPTDAGRVLAGYKLNLQQD
ncbi:hypothetical protein [Rhizobium johnstonii]|uniref:hypothetical protein n=1 Tax=Rhizobium johnstonii TaxID=3019933 RepID=UPI003F9CB6B0